MKNSDKHAGEAVELANMVDANTIFRQSIESPGRSCVAIGILISATSITQAAPPKRLFFLNGYEGNETPTAQALAELAATDRLAQETLVAMASWWVVGKPDTGRHGLQIAAISRSREYERSLMLWLLLDLMELRRVHDASPTVEDAWRTGEKRVALFRRLAVMTSSGNLGWPSAATVEKGKSIYEAVVNDIVAFLGAFAQCPLRLMFGPTEIAA